MIQSYFCSRYHAYVEITMMTDRQNVENHRFPEAMKQ